jgi:hypothetical protein
MLKVEGRKRSAECAPSIRVGFRRFKEAAWQIPHTMDNAFS